MQLYTGNGYYSGILAMRQTSSQLLMTLAMLDPQDSLDRDIALALHIGRTGEIKRSLLEYLLHSGDVWQERIDDAVRIGITEQGRSRVQASYPAIQRNRGVKWHLLPFRTAPAQDRHFRSLNALCYREGMRQLARGSYIHPFVPSDALMRTLKTMYGDGEVAIAAVESWDYGVPRSDIIRLFAVDNTASIYSSISKQINKLLVQFSDKKELNYQHLDSICSVIERIAAALPEDAGLIPLYYPL